MSLSYIPRTWRERLGTNLNKFLKSSETAASVILENAPDAITQSGTPFTADAMNNIEAGIENNYWFEERALGQTHRFWAYMAAAPNGGVYAAVNNGDIYKQSGGAGDFVALGQTSRNWRGLAVAPNGDVYACVYGGDIYKQSGGTGDFVTLGQTSRNWTGMAAAPNGDVYAAVSSGDIYKQSGGTGDFVALGQTSRIWNGMAAAPNGDVYAAVSSGDIYKQSGGTGDFVALGQPHRAWLGMAAAPNGDVYAAVSPGDIYKQSGGTGDFVALGQTSRNWTGMAAAPNGDVYADDSAGDIYTFNYSPITPASIFPVTVTTAGVTVTENRFQTIRFSGALTGNRVVTMPTDVRQYKLICDCTGAYYIQVKTASGTGVYLAPGDAAEVYCDGTNIKPVQFMQPSPLKVTASIAAGSSNAIMTLSSPVDDTLSEISGNTIVLKNTARYAIHAAVGVGAGGQSTGLLIIRVYAGGEQVQAIAADSSGSNSIISAIGEVLTPVLAAGTVLTIVATCSGALAASGIIRFTRC